MIDNLKHWKRPILGNFISVDPGTGGTGIALFGPDKIPQGTVLLDYNLAATDWKRRCDKIIDRSRNHFQIFLNGGFSQCPVFIEEPQYFNSYLGDTAARDGSLAKLIFFFGRLWQIIEDLNFSPVAVPIPQYKGQLSKNQAQERIKQKIGIEYTSHIADAVYLGLWLRGVVR